MANGTSQVVHTGTDSGVVGGGEGDDVLLAGPETFTAGFVPLNGSGVSGAVRVGISGTEMRVQADLAGLEPGQAHSLHIHGLNGSGDVPLDSGTVTASLDADRDGFIELAEAQKVSGPVLLDLGSPTASADGSLHVDETFNLNAMTGLSQGHTVAELFPLDFRTVEIHGLSVPASAGAGTSGEVDGTSGYKTTLPVASASLAAESASTASGNASANGNEGADLVGGNGDDRLIGGLGADILVGGRGNDVLAGGGGGDDLTGGRGADRFVVGQGKDVVTDFNAAEGDRLVFSHDGQSAGLVLHDTQQGTWIVSGPGEVSDPATNGVLLLGVHVHTVADAAGWFA